MSVFAVLFDVFGSDGTQFVVPLLSETCNQGLFQKDIGSDAEFASQNFGAFAYFPTMEVHGNEAVIFFDTHRV